MTTIPKPTLLRRFELAIQESDARLIYRSPHGEHPAAYTIVYRGGRVSRILVYIWNVTHGGGNARPSHEYRIQVTGLARRTGFHNPPGEKTLILGWSEGFQVFAGWDYRRHARPLGASPSMQISEEALRAAGIRGFAPNEKGSGETAIAFRSDFAAAYVEHLTALHDTGAVPSEAEILERISEAPETVADSDIDAAVASPRRVEIIETRRAVRDAQFRRRVLAAYGNRCAICGVQLRLLDAAHVLPVEELGSTDDTNNGVAMCALHHRAYDRALIAFDTSYKIHMNPRQADELNRISLAGGIHEFQAALRSTLLLPLDPGERPRLDFVVAANISRGWTA